METCAGRKIEEQKRREMAVNADEIIALEHQTWRALMVSGKDLVPYLSKDCCMSFPGVGGTIFDRNSKPPLIEILEREGQSI